jgi:uncharacterized repeat protein (TIGR03803 family)
MRCSVTVCGPECGVNNCAIELKLGSTRPAAAMRGALTLAVFSALLVAAVLPAHAQTETVLYSFSGTPSDGAIPYSTPVFDGRNLYGTTVEGGAYGYGTVFKLEPSGTETILHSFDFNGSDGYAPYASLVLGEKGILSGTTELGGAHGEGTVFELTPTKDGWIETILHSFALNGTDGAAPFASLIRDKEGNLYGTTYEGGDYNSGTVFELALSGTETILHSFDFNGSDGYYPNASLVLGGKGNLYGTTTYGGPYGCAEDGCGTVFELTPSGGETILHSFGASGDGSGPYGRLVRDEKGNLYGTTSEGGAYTYYGTVFELTLSHGKWTETILHSFESDGTDGIEPAQDLVFDKNGNLYGTTDGGGDYNYGTVFELSPPSGGSSSWTETTLWSFGNGTDGRYPEGGLVFDKEGNLYGVTVYGGANGLSGGGRGYGTVFKVTISQ